MGICARRYYFNPRDSDKNNKVPASLKKASMTRMEEEKKNRWHQGARQEPCRSKLFTFYYAYERSH